MRELVFAIRDIFEADNQAGCLSQYNASFYHIPAYQRGYKWGSETSGAVSVLLDDLWKQFQSNSDEYFLQYITVKPIALEKEAGFKRCLEVIDGQQRLTTLSVLLSVFHLLSDDKSKNIALGKLDYAIRDDFFARYFYSPEALADMLGKKWRQFIAEDNTLDKQDVYYLHQAANRISDFLNEITQSQREHFHQFILQKVKLIVNSVEAHVESEVVFKNLNSNKVPLTETELIKALLITRAGREQVVDSEHHFHQVMEVRLGVSRIWEQIQSWANKPEVNSFYFNNVTDPMYALLQLTAEYLIKSEQNYQYKHGEGTSPLFHFYNDLTDKKSTQVYAALRYVYAKLDDLFNDDETYHLLGFAFSVKGSEEANNLMTRFQFLTKCMLAKTRSTLLQLLKVKQKKYLLGDDIELDDLPQALDGWRYGEQNDRLHAVLLAISVFPQQKQPPRFNFAAFKSEQWSLEHIFPQTPEGKGNQLSVEDRENISDMIDEPDGELMMLLEKNVRDEDEKEKIASALKGCRQLDSIGNMCLLSQRDNSALGCHFFNRKREVILTRITRGSFVPKHTFDVFSKMMPDMDDDLKRWGKLDIDTHQQFICDEITRLVKGL